LLIKEAFALAGAFFNGYTINLILTCQKNVDS